MIIMVITIIGVIAVAIAVMAVACCIMNTDDEDICYSHMEKTGYAVFGCCVGMEEECCKIRRYHVNVKENNKNG